MRRTAHGFTMLEILVAMAMLAILAGISMPVFSNTMASYRFNGAVWRVLSDIRYAQSLAVANSRIYSWHWGGDGGAPGPTQSRVEKWPGAACSWPPVADTVSTNGNVITNWYDLAAKDYPGVSILSVKDNGGTTVGAVAFNARGASQPPSPCNTVVVYPVTITVRSPAGATRTIRVQSAGGVSIQ